MAEDSILGGTAPDGGAGGSNIRRGRGRRAVRSHSAAGSNASTSGERSPADLRSYNVALDVVRGVTVLMVFGLHAQGMSTGINLFCRGGYIGVAIFFALSGFLITGLLL